MMLYVSRTAQHGALCQLRTWQVDEKLCHRPRRGSCYCSWNNRLCIICNGMPENVEWPGFDMSGHCSFPVLVFLAVLLLSKFHAALATF